MFVNGCIWHSGCSLSLKVLCSEPGNVIKAMCSWTEKRFLHKMSFTLLIPKSGLFDKATQLEAWYHCHNIKHNFHCFKVPASIKSKRTSVTQWCPMPPNCNDAQCHPMRCNDDDNFWESQHVAIRTIYVMWRVSQDRLAK